MIAQFQRKVTQIGECRSDHDITNSLAARLGMGEYFWESIEDFRDYLLEPAGITFDEFAKIGRVSPFRWQADLQFKAFSS